MKSGVKNLFFCFPIFNLKFYVNSWLEGDASRVEPGQVGFKPGSKAVEPGQAGFKPGSRAVKSEAFMNQNNYDISVPPFM